ARPGAALLPVPADAAAARAGEREQGVRDPVRVLAGAVEPRRTLRRPAGRAAAAPAPGAQHGGDRRQDGGRRRGGRARRARGHPGGRERVPAGGSAYSIALMRLAASSAATL